MQKRVQKSVVTENSELQFYVGKGRHQFQFKSRSAVAFLAGA